VTFFELSSQSTSNDYLLAFANPARLIKIADGKRASSLSKTQWIGRSSGYSKFRSYETRRQPRAQQGARSMLRCLLMTFRAHPPSDLFSTMRNVVADRSASTTGGFVTIVTNFDNGFRYSVYSDMLYDWPAGKPTDYELLASDAIAFTATHENASFAVAQFRQLTLGIGDLGIDPQCVVIERHPDGHIFPNVAGET